MDGNRTTGSGNSILTTTNTSFQFVIIFERHCNSEATWEKGNMFVKGDTKIQTRKHQQG